VGHNVFVTRQWGDQVKQQLSLGHSLNKPSGRGRSTTSPAASSRARRSSPACCALRGDLGAVRRVRDVHPALRTLRNISTFDLAEDLRSGPDLDVSLGFGLKFLGSDQYFLRLSSAVGWTFRGGATASCGSPPAWAAGFSTAS